MSVPGSRLPARARRATRHHRFAAAVLASAALLVVQGCAAGDDKDVKPAGEVAGGAAADAVTFRYQSGASYGSISPFELAAKLGFYQGTKVKIKSVGISKSGPEDIQAIAAGSNDIAWTNTAPVIHADVAGLKIKLVVAAGTTLTRNLKGESISIGGLLVHKSAGITGAKDLEGKKVSLNVRSAQAEYAIRKWAAANGADADKIDFVVIAPPNEVQALQQKQIDAAYSWTPGYNKAQEDPDVTVLATEGDMLGDFVTGGFAFSQEFLDAHPEAVKQFLAGYVKAWTWAWEHPVELQEKAKEIIADFKGDTSLSVWVFPFGSRKNAVFTDADVQFYIDQLTKKGELKEGQVKPGDFYTNAFNPTAAG